MKKKESELFETKKLSANIVIYIALTIITLTGIFRIVSAYQHTSITFDEPYHVFYSFSLWDGKGFDIHDEQPALTRIVFGVIPYCARINETTLKVDSSTVKLARMGNLLFFVILCLGVFALGTHLYSNYVGLLATCLISVDPTILGHSTLATTDLCITSVMPFVVLAFIKFIEIPDKKHSVILVLIGGFALISKFSILPFAGLTCGLIVIFAIAHKTINHKNWQSILCKTIIVIITTIIVLWGLYGFSVGPILSDNATLILKKRFACNYPLQVCADLAGHSVYPLNVYIAGICRLAMHNSQGHPCFLLGEIGHFGWWYYFPITISLKTLPITLLFAVTGFFLIIRNYIQSKKWIELVPLLAFSSIVGFSMLSNMNIGIRHVLPAFPFIATIAAYAIISLWGATSKYLLKAMIIFLILINFCISYSASDNYIAYFNCLAGRHPENILVDSNLDWGQDYDKLIDELRKRNVKKVWMCVYGHTIKHANKEKGNTVVFGHLTSKGYDSIVIKKTLPETRRVKGWVAISYTPLQTNSKYAWLKKLKPVKRIGKTILLYKISN